MIGPMHPAGARLPKLWRKDDYRQQEKDAHHFKENHTAHTAKGPKESANSTSGLGCNADSGLPNGSSSLAGRYRSHGARCSCFTGEVLARNAAGNAKSDAERAPNRLRFHYVYDGNSDALTGAFVQLPIARFRHRK